MKTSAFAEPDDIRGLFSRALSSMYKTEVPQYGALLDLVADINAEVLHENKGLASRLREAGQLDRLDVERHGAIRLGTADELAVMRRLFAVMGMHPVGYYDLSMAGVPVHATAFRPVNESSLKRNPFRVFTSLLRLELIEDVGLRERAVKILAGRSIFTPRCLELIGRAERDEGLSDQLAQEFVAQALETFRWHSEATVDIETYRQLRASHPLIADVVCFKGPHINHLTPRVLDIDQAQAAMQDRNIRAKEAIEGPPQRKCPILLRQTSFLALEEPIRFQGAEGVDGTHTARFGEIEQRGCALTPKGRALYDELLKSSLAAGRDAGSRASALAQAFQGFPDDERALRQEQLAFFRYSVDRSNGGRRGTASANASIDELLDQGLVRAEPLVYEDFLPVSAAGIFRSNLGSEGAAHYSAGGDREAFEAALGMTVMNEFALYEAAQAASLEQCRRDLAEQGLAGRLLGRLGAQGLLTEASDRAPFEASARHGHGVARAVVRPATAEELAWVVRELVGACAPFVVQGAATGLVGAATPTNDGTQWVVSTQRLRDRLEIDPVNRSAIVAAGYRLSDVNRAAAEHGLTFPIDLGADPSIGGMVASNTGGARLIRYGGVRENVLAVAGVLADPPGERFGSTRGLRKNNTGLDWTQVMTGTFGAFGVVTHATLKLHAVQRQAATALVAVESADVAMELLCSLEDALGEFVSAFEGMSGNALNAAVRHLPGVSAPFPVAPPYAVLLEVSSAVSNAAGLDLEPILMAWLETQMERAKIMDAVVDKPERLWRIRHAVSESVQALGTLVAFDVSVSRSRFAAFRTKSLELIAAEIASALVCDFGHLGDGGVHLNIVVPPETTADAIAQLRSKLYQLVVLEFDGSFSAEHGIGPYNQAFYRSFTDRPTRALAGALHAQLDPQGRLGNVRLD